MEFQNVRLESSVKNKDWNTLLNILKPKFFPRDEKGELVSPLVIAKLADTLINSFPDILDDVRIVLLKCLMNSCVNGYIHREYDPQGLISIPENNFYAFLCENWANIPKGNLTDKYGYPIFTHFPYDGIATWAANYISEFSIEENNLSDGKLEILRLSIQFLCNLSKHTFPCVHNERFKKVTISFVQHDYLPVSRAACAFIYNALTFFKEDYYTDDRKNEIIILLINPVKLGIPSAIDALKFLLKDPKRLQNIYEEVPMEDKLYLLEIFHQEIRESKSDFDFSKFSSEAVSFLSKCFKRKSDLVLKTVNSYLDGTEPMEIMILLDILGVITSRTFEDDKNNSLNNLQDDKSLLINCIYLLKSLHMVGKKTENFFTPVQKLSELAPSGQINSNSVEGSNDIQSHPAFGFKAGLIRVIGNMVHKHKGNQDLLREEDGIPLLLDCCNMDARNPLIMQWTILAMRNVCENNVENQGIVRGLNKVGVVADNAVLREMGITLHDEGVGKSIGIIPLNRN